MTSFGEALDIIGLQGTNRYNPDDLKDNCVFVTMAYLLNMTSNELAQSIQRRMPGGGPVAMDEIFEMLTETRREIPMFEAMNIFDLPRSTGKGLRLPAAVPVQVWHVHQLLSYNNRTNGRGVAVLYSRQNHSGHCVTVRNVSRDPQHPNGLKYICYQRDSTGRDLTRDAETSNLRMIFMFNRHGYIWIFNKPY